jgi:adenylate cyclase
MTHTEAFALTRAAAPASITAVQKPTSARDPDDTVSATHTHTFLPGLVETYLAQQSLPVKKDLAVLFVDVADSTAAILSQSPEEALALVQRFMGIVTTVALEYCGDVKDYEGDGALLYFESVTEATQAAIAIRKALSEREHSLRARLSLNVGSIIIGIIGTPLRRSVALIGPSINLAARLLKHIPPGDIIATEALVERLRQESPDLAGGFRLWNAQLALKGFQDELVAAFHFV